jgi:hypothetical protein
MISPRAAARRIRVLFLALVVFALTAAFAAAQNAPARRVRFSGFNWTVKSSEHAVGPGPNYFSDSSENVWVDERGFLHLRITYRDGRWWSAEVICDCSPGFGIYSYRIPPETIRNFDYNAVLGCFNWSDEPAYAHREIDFELSNWGPKNNPSGNAQFVVQPYEEGGHTSRFFLAPEDAPALLSYAWLPARVLFKAVGANGKSVHEFEYGGEIPRPGGAPRINLWLLAGQPPLADSDVEIVVEAFRFERQ